MLTGVSLKVLLQHQVMLPKKANIYQFKKYFSNLEKRSQDVVSKEVYHGICDLFSKGIKHNARIGKYYLDPTSGVNFWLNFSSASDSRKFVHETELKSLISAIALKLEIPGTAVLSANENIRDVRNQFYKLVLKECNNTTYSLGFTTLDAAYKTNGTLSKYYFNESKIVFWIRFPDKVSVKDFIRRII